MKNLSIDFSGLYQPHKEAFDFYRDLLIKWNNRFNLTSICSPEGIYELHFLDSIAVSALFPAVHVSRETFINGESDTSILDVGTGAGFPGIPLKIIHPEIRLTLVDSVKKKCDFLKQVVRSLGLRDVTVIHQRLTGDEQVDQFDMVLSRAAFKMPDLIRYAINSVRSGGFIVGMKGENVTEEAIACDKALKQHKLSPIEQFYYTLPVSGKTRSLLITRKA